MPRLKFHPTAQQRQIVKQHAAFGTQHEHISQLIGIQSAKTLRKYFRKELDLGRSEANASVATSLYKAARDGNLNAQKFWLTHQAGWGHQSHQTTATTPPPFVVEREEPKS
jgi:hypothetical protein